MRNIKNIYVVYPSGSYEKYDVERLEKYTELRLFCKSERSSFMIRDNQLNNGTYFIDEVKAKEKSDKIIKEKKEKEEKLKSGYVNCAYCDKLILKIKAVRGTIYAKQYNNKKEFNFCSSKCYANFQMAHEG